MKKFQSSDIFINTIKTYPKVSIFTYSGSMYYGNSAVATSGVKLYDFLIEPVIPSSITRPSDPARYIFDASDASSITLTTQFGIPNKVVGWTSRGTNTVTATNNIGTNEAPVYEAASSSIRFYPTPSEARPNSYAMTLGSANPNLSTPNWHMFAVVNAIDIVRNYANNQAYNNHTIFAFAQYGGIYLALSGSTRVAQTHNYDGAHKGVTTGSVPLNTKVLIEGKATGTTMAVAINGGAFASASAGNTISSISWPTNMGWNYSLSVGAFSGSIHEIVVFDDDLTNDRRDLWTAYLKAKWNV